VEVIVWNRSLNLSTGTLILSYGDIDFFLHILKSAYHNDNILGLFGKHLQTSNIDLLTRNRNFSWFS